jgi:hypothetical protein
VAGTEESAPLKLPNGVLLAPTMKTSLVMFNSFGYANLRINFEV